MKKFLQKCMMLAVSSLLLASCTLSEPNDGTGGSSTPGLLKSVSLYGINVFSFTYDSSNRLTYISDIEENSHITISYNPLRIEMVDEDCLTVLDNIKLNSMGYISSLESTEYYNGIGSEVLYCTLEYDSEGHLIKMNDSESYNTLTWKNGLLVQADSREIDKGGSYTETTKFSYDGVDNKTRQWVPMWYFMDNLVMTGLFGQAPSQYITRVESEEGNGIGYAYKLNNAGQVSAMRYSETGSLLTFSFNYTSAVSRSEAATGAPAYSVKHLFGHKFRRHHGK